MRSIIRTLVPCAMVALVALLLAATAAGRATAALLSALPPRDYVVGTYDGAELQLYVNGRLVASSRTTGRIDRTPASLEIGSYVGHAIWDGTIDEVAIYDRALAPSLIGARYRLGLNVGSGGSSYETSVMQTPGLVGYWRLDDHGRVATDATQRNNGIYTGGVSQGHAGLIAGNPDTAVLFNGRAGSVHISPSHSLEFSKAFTLEAWVTTVTIGNRAIIARPGSYFLETDVLGQWGVGVWTAGTLRSVYSRFAARAPTPASLSSGSNGAFLFAGHESS